MSLVQLIYSSKPFGYDAAMLDGILATARRNNPTQDITGALICRGDLYLQMLEGPDEAVMTLFGKIVSDDRHSNVVKRTQRPVKTRLFGAWAMRHDPARSWMWSKQEVDAGALDTASEDDIIDVFARLALEPGDR